MRSRQSLVVVGNGMAGMRTVDHLLALAPDRYDITVFGAEPHGNYNRILLSPVLAGDQDAADIVLHPLDWYKRHGIVLHAGDPVEAIDRAQRLVCSRAGRTVHYDRLLLATGSRPFIVPVPGHSFEGVIGFRDLADVAYMRAASRRGGAAVVIGGGLLGLEAACALRRQGMRVTVVHLTGWLMNQQLDVGAAGLLANALRARGLDILLNAHTAAIEGERQVEAVRLADGRILPADLVVMAAGVRPNVELARAAGLHCDRAVVVDDTLQTYDPRVYAVGECVQHRGATFGLVAPLWEQARVCAAHLAGVGNRRFIQECTPTRLKVTGIDLYSVGDFAGGPGTEDMVLRDQRRSVYKRLVLRGSHLVGAVLFGDVADGAWYAQLIQSGANVRTLRQHLLFGPALAAA